MSVNTEVDQYAVVGNPIHHSKSPKIHGEFAVLTGEKLEYSAIQAPIDDFSGTVHSFFGNGGKGLNVTVPFKEQAWSLSNELSDRARLAGAVNTLYSNEKGEICGENTDGVGLVRDLTINHKITLADKRILILGAGGAVRGVLLPILEQNPHSITIANRTVAKAEQLVELFTGRGELIACGFSDLDEPFDIIINGTSASLQGDLPPLSDGLVNDNTVTYDMMYAPDKTVFNRWAESLGAAQTFDGLGMLVEQAAESFYIWRKVRVDTQPVLAMLRAFD
ncbi:shikimate dehydrogenase [Alkalimarinus sediminis]|uniref:Shikimate dehydrogenase (NADP(+)) n=1 Tax=Alkalimarinus sediminis TaxID=1632866 RepID=A0A9E8KJH3_9ALTE|nr:shikimate dehydrogenase [Alkalimarinus sediminis]UZW75051.1 shikimate dehydrogenase [Alkalimarinus sediminis]